MDPGLIGYTKNGQQNNIIFFTKDCDSKVIPKLGDKVRKIFKSYDLSFMIDMIK